MPIATSDAGDTVLYEAHTAFTGSSGGNINVLYQATRTPGGWQTRSMNVPATSYGGSNPLDYSSDLNGYFAQMSSPDVYSAPLAFSYDGFIVGGDGSVVSVTPPGRRSIGSNVTGGVIFSDGASEDLSHLLFKATPSPGLVPGDTTSNAGSNPNDLVEDVGAGSGLPRYRLVGVSGPTDAVGDGDVISQCGTALGSGDESYFDTLSQAGPPVFHSSFHAVSSDGGVIFFTALSCHSFTFPPLVISAKPSVSEVFARVGGNGAVQSTVPVSEPAVDSCQSVNAPPAPPVATGPADCADATFEGASADGSRVFFTTTQASEVPGNTDATENLYMASGVVVPGTGQPGQLQKVRVSTGDSSGQGAQVQGVVRVSDDGSHVYFVARGVLASGATAGANNLYVYGPDPANPAVGKVTYIADLCSGTGLSGTVGDTQCVSSSADDALFGDDNSRAAQTTPDGRFLVFDSYGQLTSDDTDSALDVYIYDSVTGSLRRVSVGHDGADGDGNDSRFDATISIPEFDCGSYASLTQRDTRECPAVSRGGRAVSDDGSFVFFTTSEALQSGDLNGAPDVYEWHAGQVSLISDGQNPDTTVPAFGQATQFVGSSSSGQDVFFQTTTVLDPAGGDGAYSLYDARINGGFPTSPEPVKCSEDACQGPLSATPGSVTPAGSATTIGGTNLKPSSESEPAAPTKAVARCKRGFVHKRVHGKQRCVRAPRHPVTHSAHK